MEEPQVGDVYNVSLGLDHHFIAVVGVTQTESSRRSYLTGVDSVETVDVVSMEVELLDGIYRGTNNRQIIVDLIEQGWISYPDFENIAEQTINTEEYTVEVSLTLD